VIVRESAYNGGGGVPRPSPRRHFSPGAGYAGIHDRGAGGGVNAGRFAIAAKRKTGLQVGTRVWPPGDHPAHVGSEARRTQLAESRDDGLPGLEETRRPRRPRRPGRPRPIAAPARRCPLQAKGKKQRLAVPSTKDVPTGLALPRPHMSSGVGETAPPSSRRSRGAARTTDDFLHDGRADQGHATRRGPGAAYSYYVSLHCTPTWNPGTPTRSREKYLRTKEGYQLIRDHSMLTNPSREGEA